MRGVKMPGRFGLKAFAPQMRQADQDRIEQIMSVRFHEDKTKVVREALYMYWTYIKAVEADKNAGMLCHCCGKAYSVMNEATTR